MRGSDDFFGNLFFIQMSLSSAWIRLTGGLRRSGKFCDLTVQNLCTCFVARHGFINLSGNAAVPLPLARHWGSSEGNRMKARGLTSLLAGAIGMIKPGFATDIAGMLILAGVAGFGTPGTAGVKCERVGGAKRYSFARRSAPCCWPLASRLRPGARRNSSPGPICSPVPSGAAALQAFQYLRQWWRCPSNCSD